jgi:hypothetical protein
MSGQFQHCSFFPIFLKSYQIHSSVDNSKVLHGKGPEAFSQELQNHTQFISKPNKDRYEMEVAFVQPDAVNLSIQQHAYNCN